MHFCLTNVYTVQQECLAEGKFGEFGKLSVVRQTSTCQILAYKWYPYGRNLSVRQAFFAKYFQFDNLLSINPAKHSPYMIYCNV